MIMKGLIPLIPASRNRRRWSLWGSRGLNAPDNERMGVSSMFATISGARSKITWLTSELGMSAAKEP